MKVSFEPLSEGKKAKPVVFDAKVSIGVEKAIAAGQWQYVASFTNLSAQVKALLDSVPTQERRQAKRFREYFQVLSREFPGYKALAVDISMLGMGVTTEGTVPVGSLVELLVDLGDAPEADASGRVPIAARVVHCAKKPDGRFRIGLCFEDLSDGAGRALQSYVRRL